MSHQGHNCRVPAGGLSRHWTLPPQLPACPCGEEARPTLFIPPGRVPNSGMWLLGWNGVDEVGSLWGSSDLSREKCLNCLVAYKLS